MMTIPCAWAWTAGRHGIVDHMFTSAPATLNAATATSLIFLIAGVLAVAASLQQIYEKVFRQDHRGIGDLGRLLTWIVVLCVALVAESLAARPVSSAAAGGRDHDGGWAGRFHR